MERFKEIHEAGYVGEDIQDSNLSTDLKRKCLVVKQVVQDGDFSLDEALQIYKMSRTDFERFLADDVFQHLHSSVSNLGEEKVKVIMAIEVLRELYLRVLVNIDMDTPKIVAHLDRLSKQVNEGKVAV